VTRRVNEFVILGRSSSGNVLTCGRCVPRLYETPLLGSPSRPHDARRRRDAKI